MKIKDYETYDEREILNLYQSVGWTSYTDIPTMLKAAFEGSILKLAAYEHGQLVGILRAVGDGCSILYIQDLLVKPEYQRKGVGKMLLKTAQERYPSIYQTVLLTESMPQFTAFYRACGFTAAQSMNCTAFVRIR